MIDGRPVPPPPQHEPPVSKVPPPAGPPADGPDGSRPPKQAEGAQAGEIGQTKEAPAPGGAGPPS
eukprot:3410279-Lingulodinium_polyedra.AAC.1